MPNSQQSWSGRKVLRTFVSLGMVAGGAYLAFALGDDYMICSGYGPSALSGGIRATYVGYFLLILGGLALCGVNIFRSGPLDSNCDAPPNTDSTESHW
jgi:hypothetical protein